MKTTFLRATLFASVLCLFALPANALVYSFQSVAFTFPGYGIANITQTALTWSRGDRVNALEPVPDPGTFVVRDTALDVISLVDTNTEEVYLSPTAPSGDTQVPLNGVAPVPEPGTLLLLGSGLCGMLLYRKEKRASLR